MRLHEAGEMAGLNDAREWLAHATMSCDDVDAVEHYHLVIAEEDLDGPANGTVRNAVANRLDVDECVRGYSPRQALLSHR